MEQTTTELYRPREPEIVTQVNAARLVDVSARTIARWERQGKLKGKRVGGMKFYAVEDVRKVVKS